MSGTKLGGQRAAKTNKERHGEGFYARIGAMGGHNGKTGGFACNKVGKDGLTGQERAKLVGAIGGLKSKRGPAKRDAKGRPVNKDGNVIIYPGRPKKYLTEVSTPEHGKLENIHLWQKLFRGGKTSIDMGEDNA